MELDLFTICLLLWLSLEVAQGQELCDHCDCKLSSDVDERAIFNVKMRCSVGSIKWNSAYGAIRLEFKPQLPNDYRLCFVLDSQHTVTQVSQESAYVRRSNYRRKVESLVSTSLTPLVTAQGKSEELCVLGRTDSPVLLYLEVERSNKFTGIPTVSFQYDIQKVTDEAVSDPMEECRPCTPEELLDAYCTSDFVVVGSIQDIHHENDSDRTRIDVAVAQLVHQSANIFTRVRRNDRHLSGSIHAPQKCGITSGKGDFLFTGRFRLGKPILRCAPFFEEWQKISNYAECVFL